MALPSIVGGRARDRGAHRRQVERPASARTRAGRDAADRPCRASHRTAGRRVLPHPRPSSRPATRLPADRDDLARDRVARERGDVPRSDGIAEPEQREVARRDSRAASRRRVRRPERRRPARRESWRRVRGAKSGSRSGVLSGESARIAGTESRPLLTSRRANACFLREREHRIAERPRHTALRRDEVGRARRVEDVLVGGTHALDVVGVEQALRRPSRSARARASRRGCRRPGFRCWRLARRTATPRARRRPRRARGRGESAACAGMRTCRRSPIRSRTSASSPSMARRRGRMRSGLRSSSGSASQPSWKSMRHTSSACRCSSADWFGWNGGSNQNQRSVGKSDFMWMSAIRKRSRNTCPSHSRPSICRTALREPSAAISQSQAERVFALRRGHAHVDAVRPRHDADRPCSPSAGRPSGARARARRDTPRTSIAAG